MLYQLTPILFTEKHKGAVISLYTRLSQVEYRQTAISLGLKMEVASGIPPVPCIALSLASSSYPEPSPEQPIDAACNTRLLEHHHPRPGQVCPSH